MAVTGKFLADFASFYDACQKAEVSLKGFEQGGAKVETAMNRVSNSFSGTKIIQDATLMAEAVERIGGTGRLTERELARLKTTVGEATEKMRAMGVEVPPAFTSILNSTTKMQQAFAEMDADRHFVQLATDTRQADAGLSTMLGTASKLAGALGIAFGVGQVVSFGRAVLQTADAIQRMSDQTGLSLGAVQELQYVSGQTSVSVEGLVGAIQNLQIRLGDPGTGAAAAVGRLTGNLAEFQSLESWDQMLALATAIQKIESPTLRAEAAASVFGKTWKEILPALIGDMDKLAKAAPKLADEEVKALEAWGDALDELARRARVAAGKFVIAMKDMATAATKNPTASREDPFVEQLQREQAEADDLAKTLAAVPPPARMVSEELGKIALSAEAAADAEADLTASAQLSIIAHQEDAKALAAYARQQEAIFALAGKLFGADDIQTARNYAEAIGDVGRLASLSAEGLEEVAKVMLAGLDAAIRSGLATDQLTSRLVELYLAASTGAREAAASFKLMQDQAEAAARAAAEAAAFTAQTKALVDSIQQSGTGIWTSDMGAPPAGGNVWTPGMGVPARGNIWSSPPPLYAGPTGAATSVTNNTINMNGLLMTTDPSAREALRKVVDDALVTGAKRSRKLSF